MFAPLRKRQGTAVIEAVAAPAAPYLHAAVEGLARRVGEVTRAQEISADASQPGRSAFHAALAEMRQAVDRIAQLPEYALRPGAVTRAALFDERHPPIAGTNPKQATTGFVALADRLFPQVPECVLAWSDKLVYCVAAGRNRDLATYNRKYKQPQRGDLARDTSNSRCRRIIDGRTGLAPARNRGTFVRQPCRRDMGGGHFVVTKEAAAPVLVAGRHRGALRLDFRFR